MNFKNISEAKRYSASHDDYCEAHLGKPVRMRCNHCKRNFSTESIELRGKGNIIVWCCDCGEMMRVDVRKSSGGKNSRAIATVIVVIAIIALIAVLVIFIPKGGNHSGKLPDSKNETTTDSLTEKDTETRHETTDAETSDTAENEKDKEIAELKLRIEQLEQLRENDAFYHEQKVTELNDQIAGLEEELEGVSSDSDTVASLKYQVNTWKRKYNEAERTIASLQNSGGSGSVLDSLYSIYVMVDPSSIKGRNYQTLPNSSSYIGFEFSYSVHTVYALYDYELPIKFRLVAPDGNIVGNDLYTGTIDKVSNGSFVTDSLQIGQGLYSLQFFYDDKLIGEKAFALIKR